MSSEQRRAARGTRLDRVVWLVLAFAGGVAAARVPALWRQVTRLDGTAIVSTLIGTAIPAAAGYAFAKASALSSTKALARAQLEANDEYTAQAAADRQRIDRQRQDQWAQLRQSIGTIPGASEARPLITLVDYHRTIDLLVEHCQRFGSLYGDVDHAQRILAGLEDHRAERARRLDEVSALRASFDASQYRGYDEGFAHNQLRMAEDRLRPPNIAHAVYLIASYRADYQDTGDSFTDAHTISGATLAHVLAGIATDHRQVARLLPDIQQLLDDPVRPFDLS